MTLDFTGPSTYSQAVNLTPSDARCTGSPLVCTFAVTLLAGSYTATVSTYDEAPVGGSIPARAALLSTAKNVAFSVTGGISNTIGLTLDGVVAGASISSIPAFVALESRSSPVDVHALDADGNIIVSDGYVDDSGNPVAIALAVSGGDGRFHISPAALTSAAQGPATLTYDATGLTPAEFNAGLATLSVTATPGNGAAAGSATLNVPAAKVEFTGMNRSAIPNGITSGPDGMVWFTEGGSVSAIGTMTLAGAYSEFPLPTSAANPFGIATGPDGDLWFTEGNAQNVGKIGPATHAIAEYPVAGNPLGIATGSDSNLWFAECAAHAIANIVPSTQLVTTYQTSKGTRPIAIVLGPDGNLWFTEPGLDAIGEMTTAGTLTEFRTPSSAAPRDITVGPDGAMWFTEQSSGAVGRITTAGSITEYPIAGVSFTDTIASGSDGNVWTSSNGFLIRVTTAGVATLFAISSGGPISGMTKGSDGNVYYLDQGTPAIGRITL